MTLQAFGLAVPVWKWCVGVVVGEEMAGFGRGWGVCKGEERCRTITVIVFSQWQCLLWFKRLWCFRNKADLLLVKFVT